MRIDAKYLCGLPHPCLALPSKCAGRPCAENTFIPMSALCDSFHSALVVQTQEAHHINRPANISVLLLPNGFPQKHDGWQRLRLGTAYRRLIKELNESLSPDPSMRYKKKTNLQSWHKHVALRSISAAGVEHRAYSASGPCVPWCRIRQVLNKNLRAYFKISARRWLRKDPKIFQLVSTRALELVQSHPAEAG